MNNTSNSTGLEFNRVDYGVLAGLVAISLFWVHAFQDNILDDAYIYLRISENIANGNGWAFNQGHPANAATSPLYVLTLAFLRLIGLTGQYVLVSVFLVGLIAAGTAVYLTMKDHDRVQAAVMAAVTVSWPDLLRSVGLETSLFMAIVMLTGLAYSKGPSWLAGFLAGLTSLARPEGVAIVPLILILEAVRNRRVHWPVLLASASFLGGWLAYSVVEFGSIWPHTAEIKKIQSTIEWWGGRGPWVLLFLKSIPLYPLTICLAALGVAVIVRNIRGSTPFLAVVLLFGIIQAAAYSALGAPPHYWWYFVPGGLGFGFAAIHAAFALFPVAAKESSIRIPPGVLKTTVGVICGSYIFSIAVPLHDQAFKSYRLSDEYRAAATWLKRHASPSDWVAANEIGYIGYYSGLNVKDMLGLLHREALQPLRERKWDWWFEEADPPNFIALHEPRWIGEPMDKSHDYPWPRQVLGRFNAEYRKVFEVKSVAIYERRDHQFGKR